MTTPWITKDETPSPQRAAVMLVAVLAMSNEAEKERDPFTRRMRLNEMQAAIQGARSEIEAFAEGIMFREDDDAGEG